MAYRDSGPLLTFPIILIQDARLELGASLSNSSKSRAAGPLV